MILCKFAGSFGLVSGVGAVGHGKSYIFLSCIVGCVCRLCGMYISDVQYPTQSVCHVESAMASWFLRCEIFDKNMICFIYVLLFMHY